VEAMDNRENPGEYGMQHYPRCFNDNHLHPRRGTLQARSKRPRGRNAQRDASYKEGAQVNDKSLVCMACLIVVSYFIYMWLGPGGDGLIYASVVGSVCLLAGVKYERNRAQAISPSHQIEAEEEAQA
jgi:hypothetical protein